MQNIKTTKNSYKYILLGFFVLSFVLISKIAFGVPGDPIVEVTATPTSVISGGISYINWSSANSDSCVLSGGNITGSGTSTSSPGIPTNSILVNTTYTVTCTNEATGATASDSVTVTIGTTPVITVLTATPSSVVSGGTSTSVIHWESNVATSCTLSPGNGTGTTGNFTTPALTTNTTYTLNCVNSASGATASQTVTVTVTNGNPPPGNPITVGVYASPNPIYSDNDTTISWFSTGASYCASVPSQGGGVGKTSSFVTPKLTSNQTYTVTCSIGGSCKVKSVFASYSGTCEQDDDGNAITDAVTCLDRLGPGHLDNTKVCDWDNSTATATNQSSVLVTVLPPPGTPGNSITDVKTKEVSTDVSDKKTMVKFLGEMNPGGDPNVVAYFRYSTVAPGAVTPIFCNQIYGSNMRATNEIPVRGNTIRQVSIEEGDLEPDTTYYYCVVGSTTNQIEYGGVMSFTTEGELSITTKGATVVDDRSAYLKGFYNTNVPAKTWFEYRKRAPKKEQQSNSNILSRIINVFDFFFKTEHALAVINTTNEPSIYGWKKVNERTQKQKSNGDLSFLLSGLSSSTVYEFRAVIKDNVKSTTKYGIISSFKTKGTGSTGPGGGGEGVGYQDPCANMDTDINCNGTGGEGGGGTGILSGGLPDLIAGPTTLSNYLVNTPTVISATIKNQGDASTINPSPIKNIAPPTSGQTGFLNFLKTEKALAVTSTTGTPTLSPKNNFYNFFQVSTRPQTSTDSATGVNNSIVNFPAISMFPLGPRSSSVMNQNYTFTSMGIYYIRACADKKSPTDMGLIRESYEDNNCGGWSRIVIGDGSGDNGGGTGDDGGYGNGGGGWNSGGDNNGNGNGNPVTDPSNLVLGQIATPPDLAIVRYHEGIETVLHRQIIANIELAESYGYKEGDNLEAFAWQLADYLARKFGYVGKNGKEIRVIPPDIAAYQLDMKGGVLTIYEYYDNKVVNIQKITNTLRNIYKYEYYFRKIVNKVF